MTQILGTKTLGQGHIQTYVALNDGAGMLIPAATAETRLGARFNKGSGISPDIFVSSGIANGENYADDPIVRRAVDVLMHG
jgi:carboxyl-terminal processing protease